MLHSEKIKALLQSFIDTYGIGKRNGVYYIIKINMGIILWIIFGALVGWIASLIMKTDSQQGALMNVVIGVVGAVIGGWLMSIIGQGAVSGFNLYSFIVALIGAVVLISVVKFLRHA